MGSSIIICTIGDISIFLLIKSFLFVLFCCLKKNQVQGLWVVHLIQYLCLWLTCNTCYNDVSVSSIWIFSIVAVHLLFLFDLKDLAALVVRLLLWENTVIVTVYLLYWLCNNIQLVLLNQNQLMHPLRSQKKTGIKLFF